MYASVELFRSSPFFLAIEDAFADRTKSDLFFRLHFLQVTPPSLPWGEGGRSSPLRVGRCRGAAPDPQWV